MGLNTKRFHSHEKKGRNREREAERQEGKERGEGREGRVDGKAEKELHTYLAHPEHTHFVLFRQLLFCVVFSHFNKSLSTKKNPSKSQIWSFYSSHYRLPGALICLWMKSQLLSEAYKAGSF